MKTKHEELAEGREKKSIGTCIRKHLIVFNQKMSKARVDF